MLDSMYIAASGMHAQQTAIDVTANNLANVNTVAYKRGKVFFADVMYRVDHAQMSAQGENTANVGSVYAGEVRIFEGGDVRKTDEPLDLAIRGDGFFELFMEDGSRAYTRNGAFRLDNEGYITSRDGYRLASNIQIPPDSKEVIIQSDGKVIGKVGDDSSVTDFGRIDIYRFANPSDLKPLGDYLYAQTNKSGDAELRAPGESPGLSIQQGYLEMSNVKLVDEIANLMMAQRAYAMNAKVVQAADEVMGIVNSLRR